MDLEKLKQEQKKLAEKVVISRGVDKISLISGSDQAVFEDKIISAIVVIDYKTWEVIEKKYAVITAPMPYIPGYLSYRESPAIFEAYQKLKNEPDLLMIEGNGILHPRMIGLASHVGLLLSKPTVGIAKKLLCGRKDGDTIYLGKDAVGKEVETKSKSNPIFVSPGHLITLSKSVEIVKHFIKEPYKYPYPLAMAHKYAAKIKRKMKAGEKEFVE